MEKYFEFLEHTADIKFRSYGKNISEAFENSIKAISKIFSRGDKIKEKITKKIKLEGKDTKSLLFNLIEELIFLMDTQNFVVSSGKLKIKGNELQGTLKGDNVKNYEDLDQIKAPTYFDMYIKESKNNCELQMVVDV